MRIESQINQMRFCPDGKKGSDGPLSGERGEDGKFIRDEEKSPEFPTTPAGMALKDIFERAMPTGNTAHIRNAIDTNYNELQQRRKKQGQEYETA